MKIYISADLEGITGVTHWNEATPNTGFIRGLSEHPFNTRTANIIPNAGVLDTTR